MGNLDVLEAQVILFEGHSAYNGTPIVVIATFGSRNVKTGPMVQTWILVRSVRPVVAVGSSLLESGICGTCPLRAPRRCYVKVHEAPTAIYDKWARGGYPPVDWDELGASVAHHGLRIGAYGDPMVVPIHVWEMAVARASKHTGYTHMWRDAPRDARWQRLLMASCDSEADVKLASSYGWSTYRAGLNEGDAPTNDEIRCPENTIGITCKACGLCNGTKQRQRHIYAEDVNG